MCVCAFQKMELEFNSDVAVDDLSQSMREVNLVEESVTFDFEPLQALELAFPELEMTQEEWAQLLDSYNHNVSNIQQPINDATISAEVEETSKMMDFDGSFQDIETMEIFNDSSAESDEMVF